MFVHIKQRNRYNETDQVLFGSQKSPLQLTLCILVAYLGHHMLSALIEVGLLTGK